MGKAGIPTTAVTRTRWTLHELASIISEAERALNAMDYTMLWIEIGALSDRPAARFAGRVYIATDYDPPRSYLDNGTTWVELRPPVIEWHVEMGQDVHPVKEWHVALASGIMSRDDLKEALPATEWHVEMAHDEHPVKEWHVPLVGETVTSNILPPNAETHVEMAHDAHPVKEWEVSMTPEVDEATLDHDALKNFVANEHVDHSTVTITGTSGVSGGGDITASRTLSLDINGLTEDTAPDGAADYVATYDASAGAHKKVLLNNLPGGGGVAGPTALDYLGL